MRTLDNARALELIEQAEREFPRCDCGQHTLAFGHRDGVWLRCSSLQQPTSMLRRLVTLDFVVCHTNREIVDRSMLQAA